MKPRSHLTSLLLLFLAACSSRSERPPTRVAAAADLAGAFTELALRFEQDTGQKVITTFGSTGLLAKQLSQGAPFDLFAAASTSFVDEVVKAGACDDRTRSLYGRGRLALLVRSDQREASSTAGLTTLVAPRFRRIAIANPEHAPYGRAAREALVRTGIWPQLQPKIVYAENVGQALQLVETGNVEGAIVALSLLVEKPGAAWIPISQALHSPLDQQLVVCTRGKNPDGGRSFAAYVNGKVGRAVMRRFGFLLPTEELVLAP